MQQTTQRTVLGVAAIVGIVCAVAFLLGIAQIVQKENAVRCTPPSGDFSETKIVGTWLAGIPMHSDKLFLREDGLYKQIVHIEFPNRNPIDYESDWQPWRLAYSRENIPYLYLAGYSFCGMNSEIECSIRDGGGYDFCQDEPLLMKGEGVLIVLEASDKDTAAQASRYFYYLHYPLGSQNSYVYKLQEP